MKEITTPKGNVYAKVWTDDNRIHIQVFPDGTTIIMDSRVIPQLRQILVEAEFFKRI